MSIAFPSLVGLSMPAKASHLRMSSARSKHTINEANQPSTIANLFRYIISYEKEKGFISFSQHYRNRARKINRNNGCNEHLSR